MPKYTIYIDIDDVCANLMEQWLARYNQDYDDNLTAEQIVDWDTSKFVKPECGTKIFDYLSDRTLYDDVKPATGALEGVKVLREEGHRVIFLTAFVPKMSGRKFEWLETNGFAPEKHNYVESYDKSIFIGDFLFDDRYENVRDFKGLGVLKRRPWNSKFSYIPSVNNWSEFLNTVKFAKRFGITLERTGI